MQRYFNVNLSQNLQTVMPDTEQNEVAVATELVRIITENKDLKAKPLLQRDDQLMTRKAWEE